MLKFFSASISRVFRTKDAIINCIEMALKDEPSLDCELLVIYVTMGHDFEVMVKEAKKLCPSARIVGGTCFGVIGKEGVSQSMQDIAIMAVKGLKSKIGVAYENPVSGKTSFSAGVNLAKSLKEQNPRVNMIHLLTSGIDISCDSMVKGIESVLGTGVTIFGATSSDDMRGMSSYQFVDDKVYLRSATAVGFADTTLKVITQATHGFEAIGDPLVVTKCVDNIISEFNGKPAWEEYTKRLNLDMSVNVKDTIPVGALAEEISEADAEEYGNSHILRVITKRLEDGDMYYPCECKVGTKMWLTQRDEKAIFDKLDEMIAQMKADIAGKELVAVFHADCIARGRVLFGRVLKEEIISKMQIPLSGNKDIPWLGMYGFGEFARLNGKNTYHNYTSALYLIVRE